jgi:signal peptidase I
MTEASEGAGLVAASDLPSDVSPDVASRAAQTPAADAPAADAGERPARGPLRATARVVLDGARTIVFALLLSFGIRVVLVEPFHIPSESMEPTLIAGDFIGATKFVYGWSHVSTAPIPLPMISGRILGRDPRRGDVIVFRNRLDDGADYVKRVIGLPGDRVQMRGGFLYLNREPVPTTLKETFDGLDPNGAPVTVSVYEEALPGSCPHLIQHYAYADGREEGQDDTYEFLVPGGHVFVMGDNRDASYDSRLPGRVGYVPEHEIVGRAEFVFMSLDETTPRASGAPIPGAQASGLQDASLQDETSGTKLRLDRTLKILPCP